MLHSTLPLPRLLQQYLIAAAVVFLAADTAPTGSTHWLRDNQAFTVPDTSQFVQLIRPDFLHASSSSSSSSDFSVSNVNESFYPKSIYLRLSIQGHPVDLHLQKNEELVTSSLEDDDVQGNLTTWDCYYYGSINGSQDDSAALSLSQGLTGAFSVGRREFFISPVNTNASAASQSLASLLTSAHYLYTSAEKADEDVSMCDSGEPKDLELQSRSRREVEIHYDMDSFVRQYVIEIMVAVSRNLQRRMKEKLRDYVLTHMTVAANALRHESIGAFITLKVNKIVLLDDDTERYLNIRDEHKKSHTTYVKFCRWQHRQFENPTWDVAVLLLESRFKEASTMGVTQRGNVCVQDQSCLVARDWGLTTGFIIAHEIGHLLNAPHDEDCKSYSMPKEVPIMSSRYRANRLWYWSACSRYYITKYLKSRYVKCLNKTGQGESMHQSLTQSFPGSRYSRDEQCKAFLGPEALECKALEGELCQQLWCRLSLQRRCLPYAVKWADGTPCGLGRWCQNRECVPKNVAETRPRDGGWSEWSSWGECTQSCNGGIQYQVRNCTNPRPAYGGKHCVGHWRRYRSCNMQPCGFNTFESRLSQCRKLGERLKLNTTIVSAYVPTLSDNGEKDLSENPCVLECEFGPERIKKKDQAVRDGTPCYKYQRACHSALDMYTDDICVRGRCEPVDCNRVIHSNIKTDVCGICNGDNSTCELIEGTFNRQLSPLNAKTILTLPKGATHVNIYQRAPDLPSNWESDRTNDDFYLFFSYPGGDNCYVMHEKILQFGGSIMHNSGIDSRTETIFFKGPLKQDVEIRIVRASAVGERRLPNVKFSYFVPMKTKWSLSLSEWSECDRQCQGIQIKRPLCVREALKQAVPEVHCRGLPRPPQLKRNCNIECDYEWRSRDLSRCSARCGSGTKRVRRQCVRRTQGESRVEEVELHFCKTPEGALYRHPTADLLVSCAGECLPTRWEYTGWSKCSATCGMGTAHRRAVCKDALGKVWPLTECDLKRRGVLRRNCQVSHCARWRHGEWSVCDADCGEGYRTRTVRCLDGDTEVSEALCEAANKPKSRHACRLTCQWKVRPWSKCSSTCGPGYRTRQVVCGNEVNQEVPNYHCDQHQSLMPDHVERCELKRCVEYAWKTFETSECSVSCGVGTKTQLIVCTSNDGNRVDETFCVGKDKPSTKVHCDTGKECNVWKTGEWTACSTTCGRGYQFREVLCATNRFQWFWNQPTCPEQDRPKDRRPCERPACPLWHVGPWGACDAECGQGLATREVLCVDRESKRVSKEGCDAFSRPSWQKICRGDSCLAWETSDWSECSVTCGRGYRTRSVACPEGLYGQKCPAAARPDNKEICDKPACPIWVLGPWSECHGNCGEEQQRRRVECWNESPRQRLPDSSCNVQLRPADQQPCVGNKLCNLAHTWLASKWSPCSVTCGDGLQQRVVTCRSLTPEGYVSGIVNSSLCDAGERPDQTRPCNLGDCGQRYFWFHGRWKPCTGKCNSWLRYTTRQVKCVDRYGEEFDPLFCSAASRPPDKRYCAQKDCYAQSCSELRKFTQIETDGEYSLMILGKMRKIYCHDMASNHPKEFIVLKMGSSHNFANTSSLTANFPTWCPKQNRLITDECANCQYTENARSGLTVFHKIRLLLPSLTVKIDDLTFSTTEGNSPQLYGTAGDCFGKGYCPQGRFHIDLRGTDFRVSRRTKWLNQGTDSAQMIYKSTDRQTISGRCGGYCGQCKPSKNMLYLDFIDSN